LESTEYSVLCILEGKSPAGQRGLSVPLAALARFPVKLSKAGLKYDEELGKVENAKTKVVLDSQGSVLMGEYSLLGRNCTTFRKTLPLLLSTNWRNITVVYWLIVWD